MWWEINVAILNSVAGSAPGRCWSPPVRRARNTLRHYKAPSRRRIALRQVSEGRSIGILKTSETAGRRMQASGKATRFLHADEHRLNQVSTLQEHSTNIRVGCAGAGAWGVNLIRNFSALGVLHSICDTDPQALQRAA